MSREVSNHYPTLANGDLHPLSIAKLEAETEAAKAQAEMWRTEATSFAAEARKMNLSADGEALALSVQKLQHADFLSHDTFHHIYQFDQSVSAKSVKDCIRQLTSWVRQAGDEKVTVELVLNSPGGDILEGFALIDYVFHLRNQGHTINTVAIGMAASMAGVILQAGDTRIMGKNAFLLIHEGSLGAIGSYGEVKDRVKLMETLHDRILNLFVSRSGSCGAEKPLGKVAIKNKWERTDWWIDSEDAVRHGFVDEVR